MSSQQSSSASQEIQQDIRNIRSSAQTTQQTIVTDQPKVITSCEQSIATEMPIVTEKIVTKEYVPVTYEKVIQKIPVVVGQRVETGAPISQEKFVQGLGVQFVQGSQQTKVNLEPTMITNTQTDTRVINQPLNMPAEQISAQTLTSQQGWTGQQGMMGQGVGAQVGQTVGSNIRQETTKVSQKTETVNLGQDVTNVDRNRKNL